MPAYSPVVLTTEPTDDVTVAVEVEADPEVAPQPVVRLSLSNPALAGPASDVVLTPERARSLAHALMACVAIAEHH